MGAALGWGIADFAAALVARRIGTFRVALGLQLTGGGLFALALLLSGRWPRLEPGLLAGGAVLALLAVVSLTALFRALALGPIAVVSPVTAAYLAVTVLLVVAFLGERLSLAQSLAIVVTFLGVMLASTDLRIIRATLGRPSPGVRFAFIAMIGFGVYQALFAGFVRDHDGLAVILTVRALSALFLLAALARVRLPAMTVVTPLPFVFGLDRRALALVVFVGVFDTLANVSFFLGVDSGFASVVATGGGAYPVVPVVLAIRFLHERLAPNQYLGIVVLLAGLVGLGLAT
ncbi:MAG: hypothetical protein EXR61_06280 [Chloroflexi bacterium]|nr:hypothetical protein [Chloroflexota bacterium]